MAQKDTRSLDVDIRFLLANERTLLAWVRTSLGLQAGGFALVHLGKQSSLEIIAGASAIALGAAVSLLGYHRFRVADRSIRAHTLPPKGRAAEIQVAGVVLISVVLTIAVLATL